MGKIKKPVILCRRGLLSEGHPAGSLDRDIVIPDGKSTVAATFSDADGV
ncbi:MAG: hypothetical protein ACLR2G_01900 [Phascolarctobacterium faecium]